MIAELSARRRYAHAPTLRFLWLPANRGPAAARNHGILAARGDAIAFTDDDTIPRADWLAEGLRAIDRGADAVLLRPAAQLQPAGRNGQMPVRWRDVRPSRPDRLAVLGDADVEVGLAIEDRPEQAAAGGRHVQDDADRQRQVGGKSADDPEQGVQAAR